MCALATVCSGFGSSWIFKGLNRAQERNRDGKEGSADTLGVTEGGWGLIRWKPEILRQPRSVLRQMFFFFYSLYIHICI